MEEENPAVSVLMAVCNGQPYLKKAIDSLLVQTFDDFEFVIVDDASTDRTPEILDEYRAQDARIRIIRNNCNLGLSASLNKGLRVCGAPLVARADDDDVYRRDRLAKQVAFIRANPDVGVVSSAVNRIDQDGKYMATKHFPETHELIRFNLMFDCCIRHPTTMYRKNTVVGAGGYNEDERYSNVCEDYELWERLLDHTQFATLSEPLVDYRLYSESLTQSRYNSEEEDVSLHVSRRMLSEYLGDEITVEDAYSARVTLFKTWWDLSEDVLSRGLRILKDIYSVAQRREPTHVLEKFQDRFSRALLNQAVNQSKQETGLLLPVKLIANAWGYGPHVCISRSSLGKMKATAEFLAGWR